VTTRGRTVEYGWTADGLIERVSYGSGMSRVYGYDEADRLTSIVNQTAGGSEEFGYGYDGQANRVSESRKRNGVIDVNYFSRSTTITFPVRCLT
jgi:YD repeat-containing protein